VPCPNCEKTLGRFKALLVDFENAEVELRAKRRRITELEGKLADKQKHDPRAQQAQEVFEYWRDRLHPKAYRLEGKRLKNVLDRLNDGWPVDELKRAVDGAVFDAYVGANGVRHDDLEFICRDESNLRKFLQKADAAEAKAENPDDGEPEPAKPAARATKPPELERMPLEPGDDGSDDFDDPARRTVSEAKWLRWEREREHRVAVERWRHEKAA
jgi:hypothetical protein